MSICWEGESGAGSPDVIQYDCFNFALNTPKYFNYPPDCVNSWPVVDGRSPSYNTTTIPYRVPFDFKTTPIGSDGNPQDISGQLDKSCKDLNTQFPGCSTTNGCEWAYQTLGYTDINGRWNDCGIIRTDRVLGFCGGARCCYMDGSFCFRTAFDETYKSACINNTLQTEFGLSKSIWINDAFWTEQNIGLVQITNGYQSQGSFTSQSYHPYDIFCDPSWCAASPAADATNFELCRNSVTIVGGQQRHASLVSGECYEWYSRSTADFQFGLHNWQLIDTMIENYCQTTPYSVDSFSCNCVGGQPGGPANPTNDYYTSCSILGISPADCPNVAPVRAAIAGEPPQLLANALCANALCLLAVEGQGGFATRNIYQQRVACPTQSCFLTILGTTFSANDITDSSVYLGQVQQFCEAKSISGTAPKYTLQDFPTIWFWSNLNQEVTNPAQTALINLVNVSPDGTNMVYSVTHDSLPQWLQYEGADLSGTLAPGNVAGFTLVQNATFAPQSASIGFTFSALNGASTFSKQVINLEVAVIATDKAQPNGPVPGPDTNPNDIPLLISNQLSPGGFALLFISILFIIMAIMLYFQGLNIQTTALRNAP